MPAATEQFFVIVHFFADRMLADDLKLSSDDDDSPKVGGAPQLCPQLLNSRQVKAFVEQVEFTPDVRLCGFYLCKDKHLLSFLTVCSRKASVLLNHTKFDTSVCVCFE